MHAGIETVDGIVSKKRMLKNEKCVLILRKLYLLTNGKEKLKKMRMTIKKDLWTKMASHLHKKKNTSAHKQVKHSIYEFLHPTRLHNKWRTAQLLPMRQRCVPSASPTAPSRCRSRNNCSVGAIHRAEGNRGPFLKRKSLANFSLKIFKVW